MNTFNLANEVANAWQFAPGLNKHIYKWDTLPKGITVLAATDESGLIKYQGRKYYVNREWKTNSTVVIPY